MTTLRFSLALLTSAALLLGALIAPVEIRDALSVLGAVSLFAVVAIREQRKSAVRMERLENECEAFHTRARALLGK